MTVETTLNRKTYVGDNTTSDFDTTFVFFDTSDLEVRITISATGESQLLVENTDYTVSGGDGAAGTVTIIGGTSYIGNGTLPNTISPSAQLVILRVLPITQGVDFVNNDNSDAEVAERALDQLTMVEQQLQETLDRAITFPAGDVSGTTTEVPDVATRAGRALGFDATGLLTTIILSTGTTLVDLAASTGALLVGWIQAGVGAVLRTISDKLRDSVSALDFMSDAQRVGVIAGTNTLDVSAALQAAINTGRPVRCPYAGPYIIGTGLTYTTTSSSAYTQGIRLSGDGEEKTVFDNRVASGFMISVDTDTTGKFQEGVVFEGFKIATTTSPATSGGISLRRAAQVDFKHVKISGLTGDGVRIVVNEGDGDGSHYVKFRQCHITGCAAWGLNCLMSSGRNELSFLILESTRVESCGTASATVPPPSGGITWRGQILNMRDGACVTNENVGLYVVGEAGLGNTLTVDGWAFENNKKRHVYITGIDNAAFRNIQLYSNDSFVATNGMQMDGTSFTIRNITIDGVTVRATAASNPYTAFLTTGANATEKSIVVRNVSWQDFDHAGQTRYSGGLIRQETLTWLPVLTFATPGDLNVIYVSQVGRYTRDEDGMVDLQFHVSTSTFTFTTASGVCRITGLPHTSENITGAVFSGSVVWQGVTKANYTHLTPRIAENSAIMTFQIAGSGQVLADLSATDMPSAGTVILRGQIRYRSA
jgi:hypothetical protein